MTYVNIPTVVAVLVPLVTPIGFFNGVLLIRRGLSDGFGKWALPGGYQEFGETWQAAGAREVLEETGHVVTIDPKPWSVTTTPKGINLIIARAYGVPFERHAEWEQGEVLEIMAGREAFDLAFPLHTEAYCQFLSHQARSRPTSAGWL